MSKNIKILLFAATVAMFFGQVFAATGTVTSVKVTAPPAVDGKIDEVWANAPATKITVAGGELKAPVEVSMKSVYTESDVYFLFQWPDATESYGFVYEYDGKEWKWSPEMGEEDRLNIMWNIDDSVANFNAIGCLALCHSYEKKTIEEVGVKQNLSKELIDAVEPPMAMSTTSDAEKADLWHWKAQRTNPVGQVDDQLVQNKLSIATTDVAGVKTAEHITGRVSDKKQSGGYSDNWDKTKKMPKYTFKSGSGAILLMDNAIETPANAAFKAGDRVPLYVLSPFVGSRGDISAKGVWSNGMWTLEEKRALVTNNADDIQFKDLSRSYFFAISVHDNSGGPEHGFAAGAYELKFEAPKPAAPVAAAPTPVPEKKGVCGPSALLAIALLPLLAHFARRKE